MCQVLADSMVVDGTAGSTSILDRDISGARELLRMHVEPSHEFGEYFDTARLRLIDIMTSSTDT